MKYCKNCGAVVNEGTEFCSNCGASVEGDTTEPIQNEVMPVETHAIKERNLAVAIVLSFLTCGLYLIYWMVKVNNEVLALSGEKGSSGAAVILFNILTCGIYSYFWAYKMGSCVDKIKGNFSGNTGILYLVLAFLGFNIVNLALIQDTINNKVQ